MGTKEDNPTERVVRDFIRRRIDDQIAAGLSPAAVHTRFPPEPNGFLHIGHAKAICLNFGLAQEYGGICNLRFDDTNPSSEETRFVEGIQEDIRWLGFDWGENLHFASGWFDRLYELAKELVQKGLAFVCDLSLEELREKRGTVTEAGMDSPYRKRSVEENLNLLQSMRAGEFPDGSRTLRAKIDMASPNMNLRDPILYRISHVAHHRTGDAWCIYPMYDWAHGQCDALEGITHSICSLEFENHRALYDWFLDNLELEHRPQQIEFARLNLTYTILSKRKLLRLVEEGHVEGWSDPRMPTLAGLRRRGYTPEAIREFCERIGVTTINSMIDRVVLDNALREDLNVRAPRRMAVQDPIKLVIENWPAGTVDEIDAVNNPEDDSAGTRKVPFSGELWIERDDFREEAPRKFHRLKPGQEVRLRYAYYVTCTGFEKDPTSGAVTVVRCTYDPESRGGSTPDGRKVRGTIHWVSVAHAEDVELRLYDHLFREPDPEVVGADGDFIDNLNPDSLRTVIAKAEASVLAIEPGGHLQFERSGYYCVDTVDSQPGRPVFNRSVALRDSWAKIEAKLQGASS